MVLAPHRELRGVDRAGADRPASGRRRRRGPVQAPERDRGREDVRHHDGPELPGRQRPAGPTTGRTACRPAAALLTKQILRRRRVAGVAGRVAGRHADVVREVAVQLGRVLGVVEGAWLIVLLNSVSPTSSPADHRALEVLHPDEAGAREERRAEDGGIEGPAAGRREVVLVGVAQRERHVDRGVVDRRPRPRPCRPRRRRTDW